MITSLGWNETLQNKFEASKKTGFFAGRILGREHHLYSVGSEFGTLTGEITGKFEFNAIDMAEYPVTGDWVMFEKVPNEDKAIIHEVMERTTRVSRKKAGPKTEEQIIASNIDILFIVTALDAEFNIRRLERFLILADESGCQPIILLNKLDLCIDAAEKIALTEESAGDVPVIPISAGIDIGMEQLNQYLLPGTTCALIGSSGVGKSTIINRLFGKEIQKVHEVSSFKSRGQHTTTSSGIFIMENGTILIDTPGLREVGLWNSDNAVSHAFDDIEKLATECKFNDCNHENEPGCAVQQAITDEVITLERLNNYRKLLRETIRLQFKAEKGKESRARNKWKKIDKKRRELYKIHPKYSS